MHLTNNLGRARHSVRAVPLSIQAFGEQRTARPTSFVMVVVMCIIPFQIMIQPLPSRREIASVPVCCVQSNFNGRVSILIRFGPSPVQVLFRSYGRACWLRPVSCLCAILSLVAASITVMVRKSWVFCSRRAFSPPLSTLNSQSSVRFSVWPGVFQMPPAFPG